jgi:hypothetical protein
MKNIAICLGCDEYSKLSRLNGAVADCKRVYDALLSSGLYDATASGLLLSPTLQDARACLNDVAGCKDLGVLTLYFAGHGGMKSGTFYLCFGDADLDKLSTTSLPIIDLFTVVGEIAPRQANFIIDACQAAGAMFDLNALMKPEIIGRAGSSSIAFLAASASDQYASETEVGGIATTATMKYLTGEKQIQHTRPFLDLVEVGLAVSRDVQTATPDQNPVAWGLNLYGDGVFASNPHYTATGSGPAYSIEGIAPNSHAGQVIRQHTEPLWEEYRLIASDHNPSRLRRTILDLRSELGNDFAAFIRGFGPALASRAGGSEDLLAASDAIATCAIAMLPQMGTANTAETCRELLKARAELDHQTIAHLKTALEADRFGLLSRGHALADLHYLPMRVSKVLAWLCLSRQADAVLGMTNASADVNSDAVMGLVFQYYEDCFVSVSDEQASWTLIFGALAEKFGWRERLLILAEKLLMSGLSVAGRVLRPDVSGKTAFNYTLARAGTGSPIGFDDLANPTELLSVLFLLGHLLGLSEQWDKSLVAFDGLTVNAYVPDSYLHFGEPFVTGGNNFTSRLGHGVWTVSEYVAFYEKTVVPAIQTAARGLTPEVSLVCGVAAYIFPDRVPYFMFGPVR